MAVFCFVVCFVSLMVVSEGGEMSEGSREVRWEKMKARRVNERS